MSSVLIVTAQHRDPKGWTRSDHDINAQHQSKRRKHGQRVHVVDINKGTHPCQNSYVGCLTPGRKRVAVVAFRSSRKGGGLAKKSRIWIPRNVAVTHIVQQYHLSSVLYPLSTLSQHNKNQRCVFAYGVEGPEALSLSHLTLMPIVGAMIRSGHTSSLVAVARSVKRCSRKEYTCLWRRDLFA